MADTPPLQPKPVLSDRYKVPPEQLTHGELTLQRWAVGDAANLYAAAKLSLKELKVWMPWAANGYTLEDAQSYLDRVVGEWDKGQVYDYAMMVDGQIVGSCGLMNPAQGSTGMGMGYWLATNMTGRGLATQAAALLTQAAFDCGAELVQIWHRPLNEKSRAIPARLSYQYLGEFDDLQISEPGAMGLWQKARPV